jgi:hypothetical protein
MGDHSLNQGNGVTPESPTVSSKKGTYSNGVSDHSIAYGNGPIPEPHAFSSEKGGSAANGLRHDELASSLRNGVELIDLGQSTHNDASGSDGLNHNIKPSNASPLRADEYQVDFS